MPALRLPVSILRVITTGSVTKGPPSPGQRLRTGRHGEVDLISPVNYLLAGSLSGFRGKNLIRSIPIGRSCASCLSDFGGSIRANRSILRASPSRESVPGAMPIRRSLPNALVRTGKRDSLTFSNSRALPPPRSFGRKVGNVRNLEVGRKQGPLCGATPPLFPALI